MTDPADLSRQFIDAFNRKDLTALRAMMADTVEYKFPGVRTLTDPDEVIARYHKIIAALGDLQLQVVQMVSDGTTWAAFFIENVDGDPQPQVAVFHEWVDGKLKTYRAFADTRANWAAPDKGGQD